MDDNRALDIEKPYVTYHGDVPFNELDPKTQGALVRMIKLAMEQADTIKLTADLERAHEALEALTGSPKDMHEYIDKHGLWDWCKADYPDDWMTHEGWRKCIAHYGLGTPRTYTGWKRADDDGA